MKRSQTSRLLFLGIWLVVLLAGYMASRTGVFAAAGGNNCIACTNCEMMNTVWFSSSNSVTGMVWTNSESPADSAILGTNMGGALDAYGTGCDGNGSQQVIENYVTQVTYSSATPGCTITTYPIPNGKYIATNGQNLQPTNIQFYPSICLVNAVGGGGNP